MLSLLAACPLLRAMGVLRDESEARVRSGSFVVTVCVCMYQNVCAFHPPNIHFSLISFIHTFNVIPSVYVGAGRGWRGVLPRRRRVRAGPQGRGPGAGAVRCDEQSGVGWVFPIERARRAMGAFSRFALISLSSPPPSVATHFFPHKFDLTRLVLGDQGGGAVAAGIAAGAGRPAPGRLPGRQVRLCHRIALH